MQLVQQSHGGKFEGHLGDAKVYSMLSRHYWWPRMHKGIARWCKSCLACATRHVGHAGKPLLTPIPVGGPIDHVGVDVVQLPVTKKGHKYAVVFMGYLDMAGSVPNKGPDCFNYSQTAHGRDYLSPWSTSCTVVRQTAQFLIQTYAGGIRCDGYTSSQHYSLAPPNGWLS